VSIPVSPKNADYFYALVLDKISSFFMCVI
jgi:hypothetical protein